MPHHPERQESRLAVDRRQLGRLVGHLLRWSCFVAGLPGPGPRRTAALPRRSCRPQSIPPGADLVKQIVEANEGTLRPTGQSRGVPAACDGHFYLELTYLCGMSFRGRAASKLREVTAR